MGESRLVMAIRFFDLFLLAAALPVFLAADLPLIAWGVVAAVWLACLAVELFAERRVGQGLAGGNRREAMGWVAITSLGRVWLIAVTVLLVGLLAEREAGLAAAVLSLVLFTVHFGARFI